jgi:hypothetical protein
VRPSVRIGIIVGTCLAVILVTLGLLELLSPNVTNFAAGPYAPLLGLGGSSGASGDSLLDPGFDPNAEQSGLASQLIDDPTEAAAEPPTATEFIPATPAPFVSGAELAAESTVQPGAKPAVIGGSSPSATSTSAAAAADTGNTAEPAAAPTESPSATGSRVIRPPKF